MKKFLRIFLCLCFALGLMQATVLAEETNHEDHCVCGATHKAVGDHKDEEVPTWTAWDDTEAATQNGEGKTASNSLPTKAGYYYLTDDVTINSIWEPTDSTVLCLNGNTIMTNVTSDSTMAIRVNKSCTFTLTDCGTTGKITSMNGNKKIGVYVNGSIFQMYGGTITGFHAEYSGGGVCNYGTFQMYGGEISGNSTSDEGGGVYNPSETLLSVSTFEVSGNAKIINNTKGTAENNVFLGLGKTITIGTGGLGSGAQIGITTETKFTDVSSVAITGNCDKDYSSHFTSDNADYQIGMGKDGVLKLAVKGSNTHTNHCICGASHTKIGDHDDDDKYTGSWTAWLETDFLPSMTGYYYLTKDVTINSAWEPTDGTVLCLNGHKITQDGLNRNGIEVGHNYNFVLTDCRNAGKIIKTKTDSGIGGHGVQVNNNGTFEMYSGTITGFKDTSGGGVLNYGTFKMYGGKISSNTANNGGGVYNENGVTFLMYGGEISDNTALNSDSGGAYNRGTFEISGNVKIINNTKGTAENNVFLWSDATITIGTYGLGSEAKIGVTTKDTPTKDSPVAITSNEGNTSHFTSDNGAYVIASENGKVVLKLPEIVLSRTGTLDFGRVKRGYADITPETVTVTNNSGSEKTFSVALLGENEDAFEISGETLDNIAVNGTGSFKIAPKTGLGKGTYTATVTVSDNADLEATFDVTFTVYKKSSSSDDDYVAPTTPVVPEEKEHEITVDSTNGNVSVEPKTAKAGDTVTVTVEADKYYTADGLIVMDEKGEIIPVTENEDGTFSFTMPKGNVTITPIYNRNNPFKDVDEDNYFAAAVEWALVNGITSGMTENEFGADLGCSRADLVTFLWRIAGCPVVNYAMGFGDVAGGDYYSEAVRWAASLGIVSGYGNGIFGTGDNITREQIAAILYRFAKHMNIDVSVGNDTDILSYKDIFKVSEYAIESFQWACGSGVIYGADGNLMPKEICTRAQIVTMLYRIFGE